jgi:hypothetical protein
VSNRHPWMLTPGPDARGIPLRRGDQRTPRELRARREKRVTDESPASSGSLHSFPTASAVVSRRMRRRHTSESQDATTPDRRATIMSRRAARASRALAGGKRIGRPAPEPEHEPLGVSPAALTASVTGTADAPRPSPSARETRSRLARGECASKPAALGPAGKERPASGQLDRLAAEGSRSRFDVGVRTQNLERASLVAPSRESPIRGEPLRSDR